MRSKEAIADLYVARRKEYASTHSQMEQIKAIYKGDVEIPLPDMDKYEKSYVPNLLQTGLDQMAGRVASVTPSASFSSQGDSRREQRKADTKRRIIQGWWAEDHLPTKWKYRARHLLAYSASPTTIRYDKSEKRPTWHTRHPLTAYPAIDMIPGEVVPADILFAYKRTVAWLRAQGYDLSKITTNQTRPDDTITLLEYADEEQISLVAYSDPGTGPSWAYTEPGLTLFLENDVNPIGEVPGTYPTRIGLELAGQFDGMTGMYFMQAKMMALEILAVEKGIFPDTYLEGRSGEVPRFISGPHDGRTGDVNIVAGGSIKSLAEQPGYMTNGIIDRLERSQRITSGVPSEFGGESSTNIRTGRRGDAVMSAVIDFPVAEAQEMLALALQEEDEIAIKLSRYYDGMAPRTIYVGTGNARTSVTFIAAKVFDDDCDHTVSYPITGTDLNSFMIGVGQRVGLGTMSKKTAAELDPVIADAETEHDLIISEGLEQALMSGLQQQAAAGSIPPVVLSKVMNLVATDRMELPEAITAATEWYAKVQADQQAAQAAQQGAAPTADMAAAPAAMQSLAGAPESPIPGASQGQADLAGLLSTLRKPTMTIQPMKGTARGAM
jgi:predicted RecA/RadA family phage recombinase